MNGRRNSFRWRLGLLIVLVAAAILACVWLAVAVQRDANGTLRQLAKVELEAALLARQFRSDVDDLQGALLRIGSDAAEDSSVVIEERRKHLTDWLATRLSAARSEEEKEILQRLQAEVRSYFIKLDGLGTRSGALTTPLDRDSLAMFDDSANRLQSMADDFAATHDEDLRELLQASLAAVLWMRNLVFTGLVVLVLAIGVVVTLLYRDVVRPLREQLVDNEALLAKREKLAALGTLAAGVAHEIRNPLTAIKARLFTLRRTQASEDGKQDVQAIAQEVDRLEKIVRDVLGYARPAEPALGNVELSAWLKEFAAFIEPELTASGVQLSVEANTTAEVRSDVNQLKQIVLNLVRNAQEAFDAKPGRISLTLQRERGLLRGKVAPVAILAVSDNGPGIPLEIQPRLFDPFFTTKAAGTGLGLSIVARLVENQGGEIAFQSAPRAGTRFSVRLPIDERTPHTVRR